MSILRIQFQRSRDLGCFFSETDILLHLEPWLNVEAVQTFAAMRFIKLYSGLELVSSVVTLFVLAHFHGV